MGASAAARRRRGDAGSDAGASYRPGVVLSTRLEASDAAFGVYRARERHTWRVDAGPLAGRVAPGASAGAHSSDEATTDSRRPLEVFELRRVFNILEEGRDVTSLHARARDMTRPARRVRETPADERDGARSPARAARVHVSVVARRREDRRRLREAFSSASALALFAVLLAARSRVARAELGASGHDLSNFQGKHACAREVMMAKPSTVEETAAAVAAFPRVRANGVGHSWNRALFCAGDDNASLNVITTDVRSVSPPTPRRRRGRALRGAARRIERTAARAVLDESRGAVRVDAGVRLRDLLDYLADRPSPPPRHTRTPTPTTRASRFRSSAADPSPPSRSATAPTDTPSPRFHGSSTRPSAAPSPPPRTAPRSGTVRSPPSASPPPSSSRTEPSPPSTRRPPHPRSSTPSARASGASASLWTSLCASLRTSLFGKRPRRWNPLSSSRWSRRRPRRWRGARTRSPG